MIETVDEPTTEAFQHLLRGKGSRIIYGLTERDGDKYYISVPVVSANGVINSQLSKNAPLVGRRRPSV